MLQQTRNLLIASVSLALASCTAQPTAPLRLTVEPMPATEACIDRLADPSGVVSQVLDSGSIQVVNWNIQKGKNTAWVGDLAEKNMGPDLLILQEASRRTDAWEDLVPEHFASFAEGFGPNWSPSGVMTVSAAQPMTECELIAHEPWFGTRKATLVTEYGLTGSDETLLVINIHGINFTFGVDELEKQFLQARAVIDAHDGPVLFSGDFNTWRGQRTKVLDEMLAELGLTALEYDVDHRKRFLGEALDHIYVRGLYSEHATTLDSKASDHNPMAVHLRLTEEPVRVRAAR
jgi:endonuclease/exonuclease/phosphatase (EEP) superfamily protein YafD